METKMSEDDNERLFNLMVYKCWATNDEMDEIGPFIFCFAVIAIVVFVLVLAFSNTSKVVDPTVETPTVVYVEKGAE